MIKIKKIKDETKNDFLKREVNKLIEQYCLPTFVSAAKKKFTYILKECGEVK